MYMRALTGRLKVLGFDHSSTLDTVNNLAILYCKQGKSDEVERTQKFFTHYLIQPLLHAIFNDVSASSVTGNCSISVAVALTVRMSM
jgi:hypothetical protein